MTLLHLLPHLQHPQKKQQQQDSCSQLAQNPESCYSGADVGAHLLVLVADVAVKHKSVVNCKLAHNLVVVGKFAVPQSGCQQKLLESEEKFPSSVDLEILEIIESLLYAIELEQTDRVIEIDGFNFDDGLVIGKLEENDSIIGVEVGDVDHIHKNGLHFAKGEELVVHLILVVSVFVETVVFESKQVKVEVHSQLLLVLPERPSLDPNQTN